MQKYPAGLVDQQAEIFGFNFKCFCLYNGKRVSFSDFPSGIISEISRMLSTDTEGKKALEDWGVPAKDQLEVYTFCKYAGFDLIADYNSNGKLSAAEYHNQCGLKGTCKYEGVLCTKKITVDNGFLSPREIEVAKLIGKGLTDRQISIELKISVETIRNHKNSIEQKAGITGKVSIAVLAIQYSLT